MPEIEVKTPEPKFVMKVDGKYVQGFSFIKRRFRGTDNPNLAIKMTKANVDKFRKNCDEMPKRPHIEVIPV